MIQNYRNNVLRLIAWLYFLIALHIVILTIRGKATPDMDVFLLAEVIGAGFLILLLLKIRPRSNWASVVFVVYYLAAVLVTSPRSIDTIGHINFIRHLFFPSFVFFLLGRRWGAVAVLLLLGEMELMLGLHRWDPAVLGQAGYSAFLPILLLAAIAYYAEYVRNGMLRHMEEIGGRDNLTGLLNHSGLLINLDRHIKGGKPFRLVLFDLRDFHRVNLILGKNDADGLLKGIGDCLTGQNDVHDPARYYGDDFAFIHGGSGEELEELFSRLNERFESLGAACRQPVDLQALFVHTSFPRDGETLDVITNNAEEALRICKKRNLSGVCEFDPSILEEEQRDLRYGLQLQKAIGEDGLDVFFQPKVRLEPRGVSGFEALSRWTDPEGRSVSPQYFIGLAERIGVIDDLGLSVFKKSVAFLRKIRAAGYGEITLSVNLSPQQLLSPGFLDLLSRICREQEVPPERIYLEITEGVLMEEDLTDLMTGLVDRGFLLSLDDFGTGYSNLAYLTRYRFHELKIDKRFVDSLFKSGRDEQLLTSIVGLAESLSLRTVAEGIETEEQLAKVRESGVEHVQGWIFAKAMGEEECLRFLEGFAARGD